MVAFGGSGCGSKRRWKCCGFERWFLKIGSSVAVFDFDESGIFFFLYFPKLIRLPN